MILKLWHCQYIIELDCTIIIYDYTLNFQIQTSLFVEFHMGGSVDKLENKG